MVSVIKNLAALFRPFMFYFVLFKLLVSDLCIFGVDSVCWWHSFVDETSDLDIVITRKRLSFFKIWAIADLALTLAAPTFSRCLGLAGFEDFLLGLYVSKEVLHGLIPFFLQHFTGLYRSIGMVITFMLRWLVLNSPYSVSYLILVDYLILQQVLGLTNKLADILNSHDPIARSAKNVDLWVRHLTSFWIFFICKNYRDPWIFVHHTVVDACLDLNNLMRHARRRQFNFLLNLLVCIGAAVYDLRIITCFWLAQGYLVSFQTAHVIQFICFYVLRRIDEDSTTAAAMSRLGFSASFIVHR